MAASPSPEPGGGFAGLAKASVLVTGGTGAIGRAVCRELVVHGYRVFGLVRDQAARSRLPYAVVPVLGDARNPLAWEPAIRNADVVVHLALPATRHTGPVERDAAERDAHGFAEIIDRIATECRRNKKLLIHTFGALLYEPDADGWVRESSAISSGTGYGLRHRITYPVLERHRKRGLRCITVNPAFIYGRGGWFEEGVLRPMSEGRSGFIGDGTQTMHYIAATDAAAGYRLAIESGVEGQDYLLADDKPSTLGEFTRLVAREMGAPAPQPIPEESLIPSLGAWTVEAYTTCAKVDSTKAREQLGWMPKYRTIEVGIPIVVRDFLRDRQTALAE
jgi:nucleoside-diphosphate-sugar epimerase